MIAINVSDARNRIEALRKREAALKAAIAAEQTKIQKRKERDHARLVTIVGSALLEQASNVPDFRFMLKQALQGVAMRDADRAFLAAKDWL